MRHFRFLCEYRVKRKMRHFRRSAFIAMLLSMVQDGTPDGTAVRHANKQLLSIVQDGTPDGTSSSFCGMLSERVGLLVGILARGEGRQSTSFLRCSSLRGGGAPRPGFVSGGLLKKGRQRRLAKEAQKKRNLGSFNAERVRKEMRAKKQRTIQKVKRALNKPKYKHVLNQQKDQEVGTGQKRYQVRDVMKALQSGCADEELRTMLKRVRQDGDYSQEDWVGQFQDWPPEPDFEDAADCENSAHEAWAGLEHLLATKLNAAAHTNADVGMDETDRSRVAGGLMHEHASDSQEGTSSDTEDSESDEYLAPPPPVPQAAADSSRPSRLYHEFPEPLKSEAKEESSTQDSESSDEMRSSEAFHQRPSPRTQVRSREYSCALKSRLESAEDKLSADAHFQESMRRWRAGLPNLDSTKAKLVATVDSHASHSGYYKYQTHDPAAEPLLHLLPVTDTLSPSFRDELLVPRSLDVGVGRGELQGDFSRLCAASKDAHHRRFWGVPPGTTFGVLQPFVNPYYHQPLRVRRITAEEEALIVGRGWQHSAGEAYIKSLPDLPVC